MLDTVHTITSLTADQFVQFARAVGLDGLFEDLLLRARGAPNLDVRWQPGRLAFLSVVGSVLGESAASQSRYSLPPI